MDWTCAWPAKVMSTNSERIVALSGTATPSEWPLHDVAHTRLLERNQPPPSAGTTLMHLAGLMLARFALAMAPHSKVIWIACGPGNNGGDGLIAAAHLHMWGKEVVVTATHDPDESPPDARDAWRRAQLAGVPIQKEIPTQFDLAIDALFGIGSLRPLTFPYADWVTCMNASRARTIAADIPTGLDADNGTTGALYVQADYTLSLLTLKPGLFTGGGRDASGEVWFNDLGVSAAVPPQAWLSAAPVLPGRAHASHKGSYGDVAVVGGATGMTGAAWLAGNSALHCGAGRVFVCLLATGACMAEGAPSELMVRDVSDMDWTTKSVVAGCGGGQSIAQHLPTLVQEARHLVLDADALNQLAEQPAWTQGVLQRKSGTTAMTPHPLEAARLLGRTVQEVQSNRLEAAQALAKRYQCTIALKGSGTVIAIPGQTPHINPTGNAKLASAGTGDVLAGMIGAYLAQGLEAATAVRTAVYRHGQAAESWQFPVLTATELCRRL